MIRLLRRPWFLLVGVLVLGTVVSAAAFQGKAKPKGRKFALVVAVDRYEEGSLLPRLPYPERDAEGLAEVLIQSGYEKDHVIVMTRKRGAEEFDLLPTADHIRTQLELILDKDLTPLDSVIVALAGHGVLLRVKQAGVAEAKPEGFFCPMDANLGPRKDLKKFLAYDDLMKKLAATRAGVKLLFVDACRNELANQAQANAAGIEMPPPPPPTPTVAAFFSCSERQLAWEDDKLGGGHGVFFHFVIEGLKGEADRLKGDRDNKVSLEELSMYVKENVRDHVAKRRFERQNPRLVGDIGEVTLVDISSGGTGPFTNSIGMKFAPIPGGEFLMGSPESDKDALDNEKPQHRVRISPFLMQTREVTRGQFRRFVDETNYRVDSERDGKGGYGIDAAGNWKQDPAYSWLNPGFAQAEDHPVVNVSWNDAVAFAVWLSKKEGKIYRLPTESEWEYACRAGATTRYQHGDDTDGLVAVGNVADASARSKFPDWTWSLAGNDGVVYTSAVGQYRANGFGLFDMHGNVWEWCSDWYGGTYYKESPLADPPGSLQASGRVYRGGGWNDHPRFCRSAGRNWDSPGNRSFYLGFRLALVLVR
jgi:formylglycine-generating enzyme required for sulfatase activity